MIIDKDLIFSGYYKLEKLIIKSKKGKEFEREFFKNKNGVGAILYDVNLEKYVFVKQFRLAPNSEILEVVAGSIEVGKTPLDAIKDEVLEETGYLCDSITKISDFFVSPGAVSEKVDLFYIEVSNKVGDGGGLEQEDEEIDIVYMDKNQLFSYEFKDAKTIIGVNYVKNNLYI